MKRHFELPGDENRRLALVVGVDSAPKAQDIYLTSPLHASADAEAIASVLENCCGFDLVEPPFINERATSHSIKEAIARLEGDSHPDDFLLFYFSGHGHFVRRYPDASSPDRVDMYLATHDFTEKLAEANDTLLLSLRWLSGVSLFRSRNAGKVLVILDCCYAGYMGLASVHNTFMDLFSQPGDVSKSLPGGFRKALLATGPTQPAREYNKRGIMTSKLIEALSGKVDEVINQSRPEYHEGIKLGDVTYARVYTYLEDKMPPEQKPNDSGGSGGNRVILARYEERAEQLLGMRPSTYIKPIPMHSFLSRPDEADLFQRLKEQRGKEHRILGLIGQPGAGKTWLARRLASLCNNENLYPDGIFWLDVIDDDDESLLQQLEVLVQNTDYHPPEDDRGNSDTKYRLIRRFSRYLVNHKNALLIIDNLKSDKLIDAILPDLGGSMPNCMILYTACERLAWNTEIYRVEPFPLALAMEALLQGVRPRVLEQYTYDHESREAEVVAAREICAVVECHPMHLSTVRGWLENRSGFSLDYLYQWLKSSNVLSELPALKIPLMLSWEHLAEELQDLFLLVVLFPDAATIPLWLIRLVAGYAEETNNGMGSKIEKSSIGAINALVDARWIEIIKPGEEDEVIKTSWLRRQFGLHILQNDELRAERLRKRVGERLAQEFLDLDALARRIQRISYWRCLEQIRQAYNYALLLKQPCSEGIGKIERWLDRESSLLTDDARKWWPEQIPALFYQQLYNRAVEEGSTLSGQQPQRWLRLERPIGAEDRALQRVLSGHEGEVRSVAVTPDGEQVLTGSNDHTARLWESATGKVLKIFKEHTANVTCVAFSIDGKYAITGSEDEKVFIWECQSGNMHQVLTGHSAAITCVACMSDGKHIVTGSNDHSVRIWEKDSGKIVRYCRVESHVQALVVSQDCQQVIFAGKKNLWFWDWQKDAAPLPPRSLDNVISSLALTIDDRYLAVGILDPPVISIWDCRQQFWRQTLSGHTRWLNKVAFSHDGRWLVSGAEDEIACLWDYIRGTCKAILLGHIGSTTSVAFSRYGNLVTGSTNNTAGIWNVAIALEAQQLPSIDTNWSNGSQKQNGVAKNVRRAREALPRLGRQAAVSANGKYAVIFALDGAELWETEERRLVAAFETWQVRCVTFLDDNEHFLIELNEGIRLIRCEDGKVLDWQGQKERLQRSRHEAIPICQHAPGTNNVSIMTPGKRYRIESTREGWLTCWDVAWTGEMRWERKINTGQITHLGFSPDEQIFTVGNARGSLFFLAWNGREIVQLAGMYQAFDQIVAVHWFDREHVMVVDASPAGLPPHFHRLQLEGSWESTRILRY